ncbi:hypothetical protein [Jeotgalibacillus proteolyticus]|uniref:hypothetical protein n=1 Tax=Jeotgalibacillus proteolyticus TaxID=2082395 RepID=UPI003CF94D3D
MTAKKKSQEWTEAKKRCRLNENELKMAKELGMTPKSLIKNIPAPNQKWKAPVNVWIRELYENQFGEVLLQDKEQRKTASKHRISDEELPF